MSHELPEGGIPIRDAASIILWRSAPNGAGLEVLMGQRGANAVFMPSKFVFPGGGLDQADHEVALSAPLGASTARKLAARSDIAPQALVACAIRELWEETGLAIGHPAPWPDPPQDRDADWASFAARGLRPCGEALQFFFRAVTPRADVRRYDARFFLAPASAVIGACDDFSGASDELSHLSWLSIEAARQLDLPFITQLVLSEALAHLRHPAPNERAVSFFDHRDAWPQMRQL